MMLFLWKSKSFCQESFMVVEENEEKATKAVEAFIQFEKDKEKARFPEADVSTMHKEWPEDYTLEIHKPGSVAIHEND